MVYYLGYQTVGEYKVNIRNLDGDPQKIEAVDTTPDDGLSIIRHPTTSGRPIKTEFVPTKIQWQDKQPVPDVDQPFGMLSVPDRFKEIVEQIEPGVHQFLPVEFVDVAGNHLAHRWFFIVCNRLDSVDREHTTMVLANGKLWMPERNLPAEERSVTFDPNLEPKLVFNDGQIGTMQAWHDKFDLYGPFVSDALGQALLETNLSGISLSKAESV